VTFPTITDDALASLRALIGRPVRRPEPYIEVASRDAIRHWAHGIGDRNPFWAGGRVAPPTILFAMDRIVSGYVGGLPGIHAMYGGTDFRWRRAIREAVLLSSCAMVLLFLFMARHPPFPVRTGVFCSYAPADDERMMWQF